MQLYHSTEMKFSEFIITNSYKINAYELLRIIFMVSPLIFITKTNEIIFHLSCNVLVFFSHSFFDIDGRGTAYTFSGEKYCEVKDNFLHHHVLPSHDIISDSESYPDYFSSLKDNIVEILNIYKFHKNKLS